MSLLYQHARAFGLELTPIQQAQFEAYYHLLVEWNARFNLTTLTEYTAVQVKHFLDSLSAAPFFLAGQTNGKTMIDVGAGAGLPGIALAIAFPELRVTLLEATGKKVRFLDEVARALPLENVTAVHGRAEEFAHDRNQRAQYDYVAARALAEMRTLVEYTLPFARVGGCVIAYKAVGAEEETAHAQRAIETLGGRLRAIMPVKLADLDDVRRLVVIDKIAPTPDLYPRAGGAPKSRPL
jgi:16S rRNA (guanine527-N7)-methyltransferase